MKKATALTLILTICVLFTSCGSKSEDATYEDSYYYEKIADDSYDYGYTGNETSYDSVSPQSDVQQYGLKMTYTADVNLETTKYSESREQLINAVKNCGGYVSGQNERGGYAEENGYYVNSYLTLTVKVPAENLDSFLEGISGCANVTSLSKTSEDITSEYLDTEARLQSLEAQKERLTALMDEAGSLSELLEVENQLSYVIYEIESYTSQMNTYKELVAYSTVTIYLSEVTVYTYKADTFPERMWSAFKEGWTGFANFIAELLIFLLEAFPFIALLAATVIVIVKKIKKRRKLKSNVQ